MNNLKVIVIDKPPRLMIDLNDGIVSKYYVVYILLWCLL